MAAQERYADIADALGENIYGLPVREAAQMAVVAIRCLSVDVGIPSNLTELGVQDKDIDAMVKHAQQDVCALTNPRRLNDKEVAAIFRAAM
tara:strand:+ start:76 stop:348 length:273 start_codon:yes stop_codon:yes gene_type:complete